MNGCPVLRRQEPPPRGTTCELRVLTGSLVRAPPKRASGESFSALTKDLHGRPLTGQKCGVRRSRISGKERLELEKVLRSSFTDPLARQNLIVASALGLRELASRRALLLQLDQAIARRKAHSIFFTEVSPCGYLFCTPAQARIRGRPIWSRKNASKCHGSRERKQRDTSCPLREPDPMCRRIVVLVVGNRLFSCCRDQYFPTRAWNTNGFLRLVRLRLRRAKPNDEQSNRAKHRVHRR